MSAQSISIPQQALTNGSAIAALLNTPIGSSNGVSLTITPTNWTSSNQSFTLQCQQSLDNGKTWQIRASWSCQYSATCLQECNGVLQYSLSEVDTNQIPAKSWRFVINVTGSLNLSASGGLI